MWSETLSGSLPDWPYHVDFSNFDDGPYIAGMAEARKTVISRGPATGQLTCLRHFYAECGGGPVVIPVRTKSPYFSCIFPNSL